MKTLETLIGDYVTWVRTDKEAGPSLAAYLGFHMRVDNHPNHNAFYESVGTWVEEFRNGEPDQAQRLQTLRMLLFAAADWEDTQAVWYLTAIQEWAKPLISGLDQESRLALGKEYEQRYPRGKRLPLQNEILKALTGPGRKRLFARLGRQ